MRHIRTIVPADAEAASGLIRATVANSGHPSYPPETLEAPIEYFTSGKMLEQADGRYCLVIEEAGRLIGAAALDRLELVTFLIHPDYQGKGVGRELLEAMEQAARARGAGKISVSSGPSGARFFERMGYRRTGQIVTPKGGTQIGLEKALELTGQ